MAGLETKKISNSFLTEIERGSQQGSVQVVSRAHYMGGRGVQSTLYRAQDKRQLLNSVEVNCASHWNVADQLCMCWGREQIIYAEQLELWDRQRDRMV